MASRSKHEPRTLPNPGALAALGPLLELQVKRPDGTVERHEWTEVDKIMLFWSPRKRALMAFPGIGREPEYVLDGTSRATRLDMREGIEAVQDAGIELASDNTLEAARLFSEWAARPAVGLANVDIYDGPLKTIGSVVHLVYRSDKWHKATDTDYIHHHPKTDSDKVSVGTRGVNQAIYIAGPRLTVTERGIIY